MINLNINFPLKLESLADNETRAATVKALSLFYNDLRDYGLPVGQIKVPVVQKATNPVHERGLNEMRYLAESGKKRMKVPSTWQGTREEYAFAKLHGDIIQGDEEPESNEEPESEDDGTSTFL